MLDREIEIEKKRDRRTSTISLVLPFLAFFFYCLVSCLLFYFNYVCPAKLNWWSSIRFCRIFRWLLTLSPISVSQNRLPGNTNNLLPRFFLFFCIPLQPTKWKFFVGSSLLCDRSHISIHFCALPFIMIGLQLAIIQHFLWTFVLSVRPAK
jgi:hypothetical protein